MSRTTLVNVFVGPFGLHALGIAVLALFGVFLWAFNFTNFF